MDHFSSDFLRSPRTLIPALLLGALVALAIGVPAHGQPDKPPTHVAAAYNDAADRGRTLLRALMDAEQIPGLSVAVAVDGKNVWAEGLGWADLERGVAVTPETRFRLASVSKLFTAATVARLADDGRLDLDAPVQQYAPAFPDSLGPITPRQLAGHLGGIRHYQAGDYAPGENIDRQVFESTSDALRIFAGDSLVAAPGAAYHYSTFGYTLLSAAAAGAGADSTFLGALQHEVLGPLDLHSIAADRQDRLVARRSAPYGRGESGEPVPARHIRSTYKWGGGGLLGTATDLVRFAEALRTPGFFSASMQETMFSTQRNADGAETNVGLGWRLGTGVDGRRIWHHAGAIAGGRSFLMTYPDDGVTLALLSNRTFGPGFPALTAQHVAAPFLSPDSSFAPTDDLPAGTFDVTLHADADTTTGTLHLTGTADDAGWMTTPPQLLALATQFGLAVPARVPLVRATSQNGSVHAVAGSFFGLQTLRLRIDDDRVTGSVLEYVEDPALDLHRTTITGQRR
jgi:CubicO group peptidase (beta-lactamase class C family)